MDPPPRISLIRPRKINQPAASQQAVGQPVNAAGTTNTGTTVPVSRPTAQPTINPVKQVTSVPIIRPAQMANPVCRTREVSPVATGITPAATASNTQTPGSDIVPNSITNGNQLSSNTQMSSSTQSLSSVSNSIASGAVSGVLSSVPSANALATVKTSSQRDTNRAANNAEYIKSFVSTNPGTFVGAALAPNNRAAPAKDIGTSEKAPTTNTSSEYLIYDPSFVPVPRGLSNPGVLCWLNSLIQFFLSLPAMTRVLLSHRGEMIGNIFATTYISMVEAAMSKDAERFSTSSKAILAAFQRRATEMNVKVNMVQQECTNEGFVLFISMFGCPSVERLFLAVYQTTLKCTSCKNAKTTPRDDSPFIEIFTPVKLNTERIFCEYLRVHPRELDGWRCEQCNHVAKTVLIVEQLMALREIVVIIFNKFHVRENRWFPDKLMFNSDVPGVRLQYALVGILDHSGNMQSGHHRARGRRYDSGCTFAPDVTSPSATGSVDDTRWFQFDDSSVTTIEPTPSETVYMIAYHMIKPIKY